MSARRIIIDCDPGHDDAVALLLALASPDELELRAVTTTFGNVGLLNTTRNALRVLDLAARHAPWLRDNLPGVWSGADRPLLRERISAENVHGNTGLNGPEIPDALSVVRSGHAALRLIDEVLSAPGEVSILPIGPLTNLALALRLEPRLAASIREIVLMGGSLDLGNTTPAAEFNILCDPHAAQVVFDCGAPIVMFGLNLTHQAMATRERVQALRDLPTPVGAVVAGLLEFYQAHHRERYGWDAAPLHDPCTVAYLLEPGLFETRAMNVSVETLPGPSFGRTNADYWNVTGLAANAEVALSLDAQAFFRLLTERIARYSA